MARTDRPVIGWFENYVPEEIIQAAGLVPYRIHGSRGVPHRHHEYLPDDFCSFTKNVLDAALNGKYRFLDGIIFTNTCTVMERMYDVWQDYVGTSFVYMLEVPKRSDDLSTNYFSAKLQEMADALCSHFNTRFSESALIRAIRTCNENRKSLIDLSTARARIRSTTASKEMLLTLESAWESGRDSALQEGAAQLRAAGCGRSDEQERPRILITGGILPGPELTETVIKSGGEVMYEDLCTGSRYYEDLVVENSSPVRALANRYISRITSGRVDSEFLKLEKILKRIPEFSIDGVICVWSSFCVSEIYDVTYLKEQLEHHGVPTLVVEFDHNNVNTESLSTRIEAFLERLSEQGEETACRLRSGL